MENINGLFELEVIKVVEAYPSIYTKDDVVVLLNRLRTDVLYAYDANKQSESISSDDVRAFLDNIKDGVECMFNRGNAEYIDYDSAEFGISYDNRITIENVDLNYDEVTDGLLDVVNAEFDKLFGKLVDNNENTVNS
jgi:uncharacterized lipoprotein YehR (DUF1307 family)